MTNDEQRPGTGPDSRIAFGVAGVVFLFFPFTIPAAVPLNFVAALVAAILAYVVTIAVLRKRAGDSADDDQKDREM